MATRPAFLVNQDNSINKFVERRNIEFQWFPGFSQKQKQRSIQSMHDAIVDEIKDVKILEISSKSTNELGVRLSAFNLLITHKDTKQTFSVESAFQSSKVFEKGGPYKDILNMNSRDAKKDERLRNSGELIYFDFFGTRWGLSPKTLFYDWLYINALWQHKDLSREVIKYNAFTDIEFNPSKSINCQANAAALFVSLFNRGLLEKAINSIEDYINIVVSDDKQKETINIQNHKYQQMTLDDY
ncbi:DarT1-associated NADAR antitoxin family protein [Clostridium sp. Cult3]|uniref:DarT1-associated NADAR antitoxin family protein n=1 Tax=Clostridium sp. Cult3 TaxID=2079004 RepID=UPI001F47766D|nr:hypothetical protein [Clostridium sp. Cult3]MCF6461532.1 hypothetical protein [Clostridium sp. Cult3]